MFQKLDKLLQLFGGRCIIVENGEPRYVVLSVEEYIALNHPNPGTTPETPTPHNDFAGPAAESARDGAREVETLEKINREIELLASAEPTAAVPETPGLAPANPPEKTKTEYRIEDIPF